MRKYFEMEWKRAFYNKWFLIAILISLSISIWHFYEMVWKIKNYIDVGLYPHSVFGKWIGGENYSIQGMLFFIIMPLLCALPYGRTFFDDKKTDYINNIVKKEEMSYYIFAKISVSILCGSLLSGIPLVFDFLLTGSVLPAVSPQSGLGIFSISEGMLFANMFYKNPYTYVVIFILIDVIFYGLINTISLAAADFVEKGIWAVTMPFWVNLFILSVVRLINAEKFAPVIFLRPSQPIYADIKIIIIEFAILCLMNVVFFFKHKKDWEKDEKSKEMGEGSVCVGKREFV